MTSERPRLSFAAAIGTSFSTFLVLAAMFSAVPLGTVTETVVIAIVVGAVSCWSTPTASVAIGLVAFLFVSGFVLGQEGALTWNGEIDVLLLASLMALALAASFVHKPHHARRSRAIQGGRIHG